MSISRRLFIKTASAFSLALGTITKSSLAVLAQGSGATDPLAYYTQQTFTQYLNSIFRLHGFTTVDVTLKKVQDVLPAKVARTAGHESFNLHFVGGSVQLPQNTYTVEHAALGIFILFLVPDGADENGAQHYVAAINRLPYTAKPGGPRKPR